jgi:hypothetical protein
MWLRSSIVFAFAVERWTLDVQILKTTTLTGESNPCV